MFRHYLEKCSTKWSESEFEVLVIEAFVLDHINVVTFQCFLNSPATSRVRCFDLVVILSNANKLELEMWVIVTLVLNDLRIIAFGGSLDG